MVGQDAMKIARFAANGLQKESLQRTREKQHTDNVLHTIALEMDKMRKEIVQLQHQIQVLEAR